MRYLLLILGVLGGGGAIVGAIMFCHGANDCWVGVVMGAAVLGFCMWKALTGKAN